MKQVYVARNRIDADLVASELSNLGFEAVVQGDLIAIPTSPYPSVWVPDDQADAALEACQVLAVSESDDPPQE